MALPSLARTRQIGGYKERRGGAWFVMYHAEEIVAASVEIVWRQFIDPNAMARWMPGVDAARTANGRPISAGSVIVFKSGGRNRRSEVVHLIPSRSIALRTIRGPFTANAFYSLAPLDKETRVTLDADCTGAGPAAFLAPLMRMLMGRSIGGQLAALKRLAERENGVADA